MAAHRKIRTPRNSKPRSATWALALAGAATATAATSGGTAQADPRPSAEQVRTKVDRLHHEAEQATERYNGATEQAGKTERKLNSLRDEASRQTARLNAVRNSLGSYATAQYRQGGAIDPTVQLALSSAPEEFLRRAAAADRVGHQQARTLDRLRTRLRGVQQLRSEADAKLSALRAAQRTAREHKRTVETKLAQADRLLAQLAPAQREALLAQDGHGGPEAARSSRTAARGGIGPDQAAGPRATQAIAYARTALGKPYVWGATGPGAYDCSGLTQAAWQAAGVALPRTTYTQVNAGRRVARSELAPGDLVFFYSGLSHVGLYIGNGQMIHAPRPGAPVRVAPIDEMPFNTATRPA
ncbi:NlpC/P60 family protein [Streptomyces sp. 549]|uniref:C40 family peptidase n=1 Tax=Streptomyces sp. 549 TaxID=3049076 RepID=UPI0024C434CC|nr:C40 family peptidase [Streptomyces sp. 549]MDK1472797.1 NlpC/P60 family protein [Streptomyces sp. 549]